LRSAVVDGNADQHILRPVFGILEEDIKVSVALEHTGVEQLILELFPRSTPIGLHKILVRIRPLGILVEVFHKRVGGCTVEVEVILLDVLAVVSLTVGKAEQTFFQDRIMLVPQSQGKAEPLLVV